MPGSRDQTIGDFGFGFDLDEGDAAIGTISTIVRCSDLDDSRARGGLVALAIVQVSHRRDGGEQRGGAALCAGGAATP